MINPLSALIVSIALYACVSTACGSYLTAQGYVQHDTKDAHGWPTTVYVRDALAECAAPPEPK